MLAVADFPEALNWPAPEGSRFAMLPEQPKEKSYDDQT